MNSIVKANFLFSIKRTIVQAILLFSLSSLLFLSAKAQKVQQPQKQDTFFLAKKHGILGRLGRSISISPPSTQPIKIANPFLPYAGTIIRNIELVRLGFDRNLYDTTIVKRSNFGIKIAKKFHRVTKPNVIANDLLFASGEKLFPNLMADNERLLREEVYLEDARILVNPVPGTKDSVDVVVMTKDVFSLGGSIDIGGTQKGIISIKEENVDGTGSRALGSFIYDNDRIPKTGYGAEVVRRNIRGSFIDWTTGFQTYAPAFNSGRNEVTTIYTNFQKPLVTAYIPWTGAFSLMYNKTGNDYPADTFYNNMLKYDFYDIDGWFGYNFGSSKLKYKNLGTRLRKFVALRGLDERFKDIPDTAQVIYDYRYANIAGVLAAFNIFQQDFYRTNFVYGFGRDEDVPEGFTASLISGWINKQSRQRPYFAINSELTHFVKKGSFSDYTFRIGGYPYNNRIEDFDVLFNVNHFTRLRKLSYNWLNRTFLTASITKQANTILDQPLVLQSSFGIPYFSNTLKGDFRATVTTESDFYNIQKFFGFRFTPFAFGDLSLLTPQEMSFNKSDIFSAVGGGVRARNENLIFETIELRGLYFPRTLPGMNGWRLEINTILQFKYNSTFITQPDFVMPN